MTRSASGRVHERCKDLMSSPVHRIAMELAAEVELSRGLMDIDTDDPMLDDAFRREVERAAALSRALLCGEGPS